MQTQAIKARALAARLPKHGRHRAIFDDAIVGGYTCRHRSMCNGLTRRSAWELSRPRGQVDGCWPDGLDCFLSLSLDITSGRMWHFCAHAGVNGVMSFFPLECFKGDDLFGSGARGGGRIMKSGNNLDNNDFDYRYCFIRLWIYYYFRWERIGVSITVWLFVCIVVIWWNTQIKCLRA